MTKRIAYTSASSESIVHFSITSPVGIEQVPDAEGILPGYAAIGAKGNKIQKINEDGKKYRLQKPLDGYEE